MADLTNYPRQDLFDSELLSDIGAADTSITINDAPSFALSSGSLYMGIDYDNAYYEIVQVTGVTGAVLTVTRGIAIYEGGASSAQSHTAGAKVRISASWKDFDNIKTAIASKVDESGGVFTTPVTDATYADLATLQAAYPAPTNGMSAYCTAEGKAYDGIGGAWVAREAGGTFANASTTVAGKVEQATSAESIAGTATGGTGASLFATPADIGANAQASAHVYAATSVGSDSYAITVTPAISAYAAGQRFIFKADVANTGAATLDVCAVGAIAIKKLHDQALEDNDIEIGSIVEVVYDGANFQMQTPCAVGITSAQATTLTGAGNAESLHTHTQVKRANGFVSYAAGVPAATTIAHGFGINPKTIIVNGIGNNTTNTMASTSSGSWTAAAQGCIYWYLKSGTGTSAASSTTYSLYVACDVGGTIYYGYGAITVDATNITITWDRNNANFNNNIFYDITAIA